MAHHPVYRDLCTCEACGRWWSVPRDELDARCPCGGKLATVDMNAHLAQLPRAKDDPIPSA